jgi:hypothetical protein
MKNNKRNNMSDNIIPLFDDYMMFEHYVCECGSESFFITVDLGAVCSDCRDWLINENELKLIGVPK